MEWAVTKGRTDHLANTRRVAWLIMGLFLLNYCPHVPVILKLSGCDFCPSPALTVTQVLNEHLAGKCHISPSILKPN